jgi:hypothetical protein
MIRAAAHRRATRRCASLRNATQRSPHPAQPGFFRPLPQKRLQTIKHTCYSTHARYDNGRANPPLGGSPMLPSPVYGGFLRSKQMEAKILRIELELARKFRGLFLITDAASAERAERILQSIRRQARALAAQEGEPA